jgi:hypothetical protein
MLEVPLKFYGIGDIKKENTLVVQSKYDKPFI